MPFSEGSLVISCHPCLVCSIFITSQSSDRRHGNEASSFRRQLQSAALNLLLCAWLRQSNCMNPFFFSALPFRVACAFCESVPAAYPRCSGICIHLFVSAFRRCELLKVQSCPILMFHCLRKTHFTLGGSRLSLEMAWSDKPESE